jgi:outer membrane murein-binding lipoprotein Lpp
MKQASFVLAALISAALLVAGCSKSADTSSNTSASEGSAASTDPAALSSPAGNVASAIPEANPPSPDADASAPVNVTSTDDGASFTQGNKSASFGKGSADDIKASGLPLYPGIDPAATTVIKSSDSNAKAITVSASTTDDFAKSMLGMRANWDPITRRAASISVGRRSRHSKRTSTMVSRACY